MPQQGNIRFKLMIGWCGLLSVAMVIMAVVLATGTNLRGQGANEKDSSTENHSSPAAVKGPSFGQTGTTRIHLTYITDRWDSSSTKSSIILQSNGVKVTAAGLYYAYAQVTFIKKKTEGEETVTLIMNEKPGTQARKLMQAQKHGIGTVSMSQVIELMQNDTVNLIISNSSMIFSNEVSKTYWGLYLLNQEKDI
ncbi:lymphotoxin-alpha isoform X2 [Brachyhypopomus gauderio]|uniref:lymphotoxin-alpha isoform X2 n=1 Tax=Brachyhypopomus gauderio TaxID=698409 RepID=UPI004041301F